MKREEVKRDVRSICLQCTDTIKTETPSPHWRGTKGEVTLYAAKKRYIGFLL